MTDVERYDAYRRAMLGMMAWNRKVSPLFSNEFMFGFEKTNEDFIVIIEDMLELTEEEVDAAWKDSYEIVHRPI